MSPAAVWSRPAVSASTTSMSARASRDQRVVDDGRGVGAGILRDDGHSRAFAPRLKLLDCRCAESVGGREQHAMASRLQAVRELADRCRLAGAVHADGQDHERFAGCRDRRAALRRCAASRAPSAATARRPACSGLRFAAVRMLSMSHSVASTPTSAVKRRVSSSSTVASSSGLEANPSSSDLSHVVPRFTRALSFAKKLELSCSFAAAAMSSEFPMTAVLLGWLTW